MFYVTGIVQGGWMKAKSSEDGFNPRIGLDTGADSVSRNEFGYFWSAKEVPNTKMSEPRSVEYKAEDGTVHSKERFTVIEFVNPDGEKFVIREGDELTVTAYYNKRYKDLVFMEVVEHKPAARETQAEQAEVAIPA